MRQSERGFTLVEIMIVVAIIALLAAIAIPNVLRGRTTANESAAIGNIRALVSSLEMFRSVNNQYPDLVDWRNDMYEVDCATETDPTPDFGPPSFCGVMSAATPLLVQGYNYQYLGLAAPSGTYGLLAIPQTLGTTGTRCFRATETGLITHCSPAAVADCTPANLTNENTIDTGANLCNGSAAT